MEVCNPPKSYAPSQNIPRNTSTRAPAPLFIQHFPVYSAGMDAQSDDALIAEILEYVFPLVACRFEVISSLNLHISDLVLTLSSTNLPLLPLYSDDHSRSGMDVDANVDGVDEVIAEIDVVLSQELLDQLYVMQYPLRPLWRAYDNSMLDSVRFKQGQQILEMEYRLKEEERSREVQTKVSSATTGVEFEDPTKSMQTHVVRSTVVPNKSNYLVGMYRGSELHVTPLKGVLQMRPSFSYIDQSADVRTKRKEAEMMAAGEVGVADRSAANIRASMDDLAAGAGDSKMDTDVASSSSGVGAGVGASGGGGGSGGSGELKPVQFQVKKRETEKAIQNRLKSFAYLKQLEAEESFVKLDFVHRDRMDAMAEFDRIAGRQRSLIPATSMTRNQFLSAINPPLAEDGSPLTAEQIASYRKEPRTTYAKAELADHKARRVIANQVPVVISHHTLQQLPASEQVSHLFNNTNVLTWGQLCEYTNIEDKAELLKHVQAHAVLVQGVWVVRTEKSYRHRAANVRNWYLCKIALADPLEYENWYTSKQQISEICGVSTEMAGTILDPITTLVPGFGLQLKYAPDESFMESHPEQVAKYRALWEKSEDAANTDMRRWISATSTSTTAPTGATSTTSTTAKAAASLARPTVLSSRVAAAAALASSRASTSSSAAMADRTSATSAEIMAESSFNIAEMAESDTTGGLTHVDLSVLAENQVRSLINSALSMYGVISAKGLVAFANRNPKSVSEVDGGFNEDIALQELSKNATKFKNVFITTAGSDPTYESWRDIVLELFKASPTSSVLRQAVGAAFRTQKGKDAPRMMYSKIVAELVIVKSSTWYLKAGDASEEERIRV